MLFEPRLLNWDSDVLPFSYRALTLVHQFAFNNVSERTGCIGEMMVLHNSDVIDSETTILTVPLRYALCSCSCSNTVRTEPWKCLIDNDPLAAAAELG